MKDLIVPSFAVALCLVIAAVAASAQSSEETALSIQIKAAVSKVRSGRTVDSRTDAAEHLESLTKKIRSEDVTDTLVKELISLLDSPDDSVRYWVALSLGDLGPAATAAIPKLEKMLPDAECIYGVITSADGIRYALFKMGVRLPPRATCVPPRIAG